MTDLEAFKDYVESELKYANNDKLKYIDDLSTNTNAALYAAERIFVAQAKVFAATEMLAIIELSAPSLDAVKASATEIIVKRAYDVSGEGGDRRRLDTAIISELARLVRL